MKTKVIYAVALILIFFFIGQLLLKKRGISEIDLAEGKQRQQPMSVTGMH